MSSLLFKLRVVFLLLKSVPLFHSLSNVNCDPGRQRPIFYRQREKDRQTEKQTDRKTEKCPMSKWICGRVRKRKVSRARVSVFARAGVCVCLRVCVLVCMCVLPKTLADAFLLASSMAMWCAF